MLPLLLSYTILLALSATGIWERIMHVLTMKKIWAACKRHEVMVKLVKYSLCILDFPWRNLESRTLESGIQKVGIWNPRGWNPESRGQDPESRTIMDSLSWVCVDFKSHYAWLKWAISSWIIHQNAVQFIVLFKFGGNMNLWVYFLRILGQIPWPCSKNRLIGGTKSTGSRLIGMNFMSAEYLKNILL